jgi:hypothetical protein
MSGRTTLLLATLIVGAGGTLWYLSAAPTPREEDTLRWVPIENQEVFSTMGARTWRLHVPASQLAGKKQFRLTISKGGKERDVGVGRLRETRKASDPLDVTVVLYWDALTQPEVKRIRVLLSSKEFGEERITGNPVPGFDVYEGAGRLSDPADGLKLCVLARSHPDGKDGYAEQATFVLHLE